MLSNTHFTSEVCWNQIWRKLHPYIMHSSKKSLHPIGLLTTWETFYSLFRPTNRWSSCGMNSNRCNEKKLWCEAAGSDDVKIKHWIRFLLCLSHRTYDLWPSLKPSIPLKTKTTIISLIIISFISVLQPHTSVIDHWFITINVYC